MLTVSKLIKTKRLKTLISQRDLAKRIKVTNQFICKIESGITPVPVDKAILVANILGIKKDTLYKAYIKDYKLKINQMFN